MERYKVIIAIEMEFDWMKDAKPEWLDANFHETLGMVRMAHLLGLITDEEMSAYNKKAFDIRYKI